MLAVPAHPFNFEFPPAQTALVIIDMQKDFVEKGGFGESLGNDVTQLQAIIPAVKQLLDVFRQHNWLVVHTRESHDPDLFDCPPAKRLRGNPTVRIGDVGPMGRILVRGEVGNAIVEPLAPIVGEVVIDKPGKGAFYATVLGEILRLKGITHLVLCGVTTEVCVQTTMREANDRGYECLVIEEATASYFPEFKTATLQMLTAQGGIIGCSTHLDDFITSVNAQSSSV